MRELFGRQGNRGATELFDHYRRWAIHDGLTDRERLTATKFGIKMAERFNREHRRGGSVYHGIARKPLVTGP